MNIDDLKAVQAVVETGGIGSAAKRLHRVPSAVTARVQGLEEELGVPLFLRNGNRLTATDRARRLCAYSARISGLIEDAKKSVTEAEPSGRFRIGALGSMAATRLPVPLAKLAADYPELEIELRTDNSGPLISALKKGELDCILVADADENESFERRAVFEEKLVFVTKKGHVPVREAADLAEETVLAFADGCSYRSRMLQWFDQFGASPARIIEMTSYSAILASAAAGMGTGIIPKPILETFPHPETVSLHPIRGKLGTAVTELIWRKGESASNAEAFLKRLQESR